METDPAPAWALEHYAKGLEEDRLQSGPGLLEQQRSRELLRPELVGMGSHLLLVARRPQEPDAETG